MEDPPLSTGTSLYYPFIHPRDIHHVKAALFYWDRVRRIVPPSVRQGASAYDDAEDARLLSDRGSLLATDPELYEESAARKFFDKIRRRYNKFRITIDEAHSLAARNRGIHIEKIGHTVLSRLKDMGLARRVGDWVSMHDEVGALYMFCLASEMATRIRAPMFTDSSNDARVGETLLFEPDSNGDVSEDLLRVGITLPSPKELQHVPTYVVADFAERRAGERQRFREAVEGIVQTIRTNPDPHAIEDYLQSQKVRISEAVTDLRATIDEVRVGSVASVAKITVPAGAAAGIAALPFSPIAAGILAGVGLVVSGVSCYAETRGKLRQARTSAPYHYLISIESEFGIPVAPKS